MAGVVENDGMVVMEDGAEHSADTPTGGELGHFNLITVEGANKTHHTIYKHFCPTLVIC